jgi:hypothetical protein
LNPIKLSKIDHNASSWSLRNPMNR